MNAALLAFNREKQKHLEAQWPAVITIAGHVDEDEVLKPLPCAGGNLRQTGQRSILGGMVGDYALAFRLRRELVTGPVEVGSLLGFDSKQWRIDRVMAPNGDEVYVIGANAVSR